MKILKNLLCYTFLLLIISCFFLDASVILRKFHFQTFNPSVSIIFNSYNVEECKRGCFTFNNNKNKSPVLESDFDFSTGSEYEKNKGNKLEKYESLFEKCSLLLKKMKRDIDHEKLRNGQPIKTSRSKNLTLAEITQFPNSDLPLNFLSKQNSQLSSVLKQVPQLKVDIKNISTDQIAQSSMDKKDDLDYSYVLNTKKKMQDDLLSRIINSVSAKDKIKPEDVISILDLYNALMRRPEEGITKVLTGMIDTNKSGIYCNVAAYARSKGLNLDTYRKIYLRLSQSFGEDVIQVIFRVIENMKKEKEPLYNILKEKKYLGMSQKDYISTIVEASHPLYPVNSNEVKSILELYLAITNRPREGVTKVLNYETNTIKSGTYCNVVSYINSKGSNLSTYRDIYARIGKVLNENETQIIYKLIDDKIGIDDGKKQTIIPKQVFDNQLESDISDVDEKQGYLLKKMLTHQSKADMPDALNFKDSFLDSDCELHPLSSSKEDGKYRTQKEQMRLNRIYRLLPDHHSNSITRILLGKTIPNKSLPVWKDIQDAIEQIKKEAKHEGDTTTIDLNYFRNLQLLGSKNVNINSNFSDNILQTKDGKYIISKKEQTRLNRIFVLLPDHHSNSITRILLGRTTPNNSLSVWKDIQNAIEQIKKEAKHEGDTTTIDLNYFRKLQWSSIRVTGKGGSRE